jgi:superfamily II DNA/RNA helicase
MEFTDENKLKKQNENIENPDVVESNDVMDDKEINSWDDLELNEKLYRGVLAYGFEKPSPIQKRAIVPFLRNKDLVAQAQSGTGKTATFSIALLQKLDEDSDEVQGIILIPSRELAMQVFKVIQSLSNFMNIRMSLCSGGTNLSENIKDLENKKPHIIISTPGRILQLMREAYINTRYIKHLIMDEADQLLGADFQSQVKSVFSMIPMDVQVGLYTATISEEMKLIIPKLLKPNYTNVLVKREQLTLEGIKQFYVALQDETSKFATLMDIYEQITIYQMMIYCNSKKCAEILARKLNFTIPASCIHGEMTRENRQDTMKSFVSGEVRVLVTTDLLARGIDVQQVSLVINYDFPQSIETYLHRIGRSGRYGRKGVAVNFITQKDVNNIQQTESFYNTQIQELPGDVKSALNIFS